MISLDLKLYNEMKSCSFHSKPHIFTANPLISEQTPCFQSKPLIFIANRLAIQWLAMKDLLFKYLQFWRNFFSKQTGLRSAVCAKTGGWLSAVGYERFVIQILAILEEFFFSKQTGLRSAVCAETGGWQLLPVCYICHYILS